MIVVTNILKLFLKYFRNKSLCKKSGCFLKMAENNNNKPMGLIIIAGRSMSLSQERIKGRRKQRKWLRLRIRKRDSKGKYYLGINNLGLTDKKDFRKYLGMNTLAAIPIQLFYLNKN